MRARRSVLGLILVLALAGSACAGGNGGNTATGQENGNPGAADNDINPVPRDQLRDGGTLTWALSELPPNFNVHHVDGTLADNSAVMGALLPGTFNYDASAQPTLDTDYFTSIELTATDPKQVVTYRINPEAVWYDGTPITVADFQAHWKANNGSDPAYKVASTQGDDKVERVTQGADEREVIVTFAEKYADWRGLFSGMLPASTNNDPAIFNEGWREKPLTTAGPFKFESIDRTTQTITLVRNEKWWGDPPKLERLIYRVIDPDAQIEALANGEIDFIDVGPDVNKLQRAQSTSGVVLRKAGGPNFRHFTLNGRSPVLSDVRVRRALAMGIDRETIAKALLGPLGVPAEPLDNHIFMTNQKGYQDNSGKIGSYDPEAAGAILDEAGWTLEGGVRKKDGQELVVRFVIPSQVTSSEQEAKLAQRMLRDIGVRVDILTVPVGDFFENHIRPGNFDVTVFSWLGTVFPISSSKSIYANPKESPDGLDIQQNYARVGSPDLDALFDQATSIFDEEEAIEVANEIDRMIWEEVHSITLYQRPEIIAIKPDIANFGAFGFASAHYEDIGFVAG